MKSAAKILCGVVGIAFGAYAQGPCLTLPPVPTPNISLNIVQNASCNWDTQFNFNATKIDSLLSGGTGIPALNYTAKTLLANPASGLTIYLNPNDNLLHTRTSGGTDLLLGGGAIAPATLLLYKGTNVVNGIVAATPGVDYFSAASQIASGGDTNGTVNNLTVRRINGIALGVLDTGLLKNTTGTGAPSIAIPGTDYFNAPSQIAAGGDVSGNVNNITVGKVNGIAFSGLSTGLLKNTSGTGAPSIATAGVDYFNAAAQIPTGGDISGNANAVTVGKINGAAVPASQPCLGSNAGSQPIVGICGSGSVILNAWGDSLTLGNQDGTGHSYPAYLLAQKVVPVFNYGVGGNTSEQILAHYNTANPLDGGFNSIWSGRNDTPVFTNTLANTQSITNQIAGGNYVVIGVIPTDTEIIATFNYNAIIAYNQMLYAAYPGKSINALAVLLAAYNPANGVDVVDVANGVPPYTLRAVISTSTLPAAIASTSTCTISTNSAFQNGGVILVGSEYILETAGSGNNITGCIRGYGGSTAATHLISAAYTLTDNLHLGAAGYQVIANAVAPFVHAINSQDFSAAVSAALLFATNPFNITFSNATGTGAMMSVLDSAGNTGSGYVFTAGSATGSAAKPFRVQCGVLTCLDTDNVGNFFIGTPSTDVTIKRHLFALGNVQATNVFGFTSQDLYMGHVAAVGDTGVAAIFENGAGDTLRQIQANSMHSLAVHVSVLPTCNAADKDTLRFVDDASSPTYNAVLSGGGAIRIPVYCNGTAWTAH